MTAARWSLVAALVVLPAIAFAGDTTRNGREQRTHTTGAAHHNDARHRARTTWDSVFSIEQAARGESAYVRTCARCHQASLGGADESPALTGSAFMGSWNGQTLYALHDRVRTTMPTDTPGTYARQDISDVIAYVLSFNRFPAGKTELPVNDEELKDIVFVSFKP